MNIAAIADTQAALVVLRIYGPIDLTELCAKLGLGFNAMRHDIRRMSKLGLVTARHGELDVSRLGRWAFDELMRERRRQKRLKWAIAE